MNYLQLRKVKYILQEYPRFDDERSKEEEAQLQKDCEWKEGWFHEWTEVSDTTNGDRPIIEKYALVETEEGKIEAIAYYNLIFSNRPDYE
ncbi:MAG: hypothetical protein K2J82_01635 [Muribaculaceae bacterium]|nr:hypothetical protein [Muribaculaceae bacterium]